MPSHRTHDVITLLTAPILLFSSSCYIDDINLIIILIVSYLFAGFMFNGDLDIYSRPYNRWLILKYIWKPYQRIFSHRSIFTHGFILGTIIRLIYIFFIPSLFYWNEMFIFAEENTIQIIYCIGGLELGSMSHTIADKLIK